MARSARIDFSELLQLEERFRNLDDATVKKFNEDAVKDLAKRLLTKVIKRTPVGVYTDGRVGGTLRRGWTVDNKDLRVRKRGNNYEIEIINNTEYASYVEFGRRNRGGNGWVNGRFMLTISEDELERTAPKLLEKRLLKLLREAVDGD